MQAEIYDQFAKQISNLQTLADTNATAAQEDPSITDKQRLWHTPEDWTTSPTDIESLGDPWDRTDMNDAYQEIFTSEGSNGDAMAIKMQADFLAQHERAFRLRHSTPIRRAIHASARRTAHGDEESGQLARIVTYIQDLIMAGGI